MKNFTATDVITGAVSVNEVVKDINLKGAKKMIKELAESQEAVLNSVEQEKVQIENEAIDKLGGVANFLDKSVSKKLDDANSKLNERLNENHQNLANNVTEQLVDAFGVIDTQVKYHLDSTLNEVAKQAEIINSAVSLLENPPGKSFFKSKGFWTNVLAIGGTVLASKTGVEIPLPVYGVALGLVNIALRAITKEPIKWSK